MKVAIYTFSVPSSELGIEVLPLGIEPIECFSEQEVLEVIQKDNKILILITENYDYSFIENVRQKRSDIIILLMVSLSFKPQDLIKLSKFGIKGIINLSNNINQLADDIMKTIISLNIKTNEKRLHMRIQPNPYENLKASIFVREQKYFIRGQIFDISAGGFAVVLNNPLEYSYLELNKVYDPVFITIISKEIKTVATLRGKRMNIAGFQFDNIEQKDRRIIASYIHNKIQEEKKTLLNLMEINKKGI